MKLVAGNIISNTLSSQAAEFSANLLSGVFYYYLGARLSFGSMFTLSAVGSICLLVAINGDYIDLIPVFISIAKFGIAASFNICFIAFV